jgi:hypothetical protein
MQKMENILRLLLFLVFSAAGTLSIALAALGPEWKILYGLNAAITQTQQSNREIEEIIKDHQVLISQINTDPNILKRIAPLTLGAEPKDTNQPAAKITQETLARAKAVLQQQQTQNDPNGPKVPEWLERCTTDYGRITLFTAGCGLIIVSFACFGKKKAKIRNDKQF